VSPQRFRLTIRLTGCRRSISAEAEGTEVRRKILAIGVIVSSDKEVLRYDDGMDVILTIYEADEMGLGRSFPPDPGRGRKDFDVEFCRGSRSPSYGAIMPLSTARICRSKAKEMRAGRTGSKVSSLLKALWRVQF
jgi:hypothetical protein